MTRPTRGEIAVTPNILLKAYAAGIFPMAEDADDPSIFWVEPEQRGVIPLDRFHVPRSLAKLVRQRAFEIRINSAFSATIDGCAEPSEGRDRTWINATIRNLYLQLNRMGHAHSVEAWAEGSLVGGLYGVSLGAAFFGESMFSRRPNASKVALVHLVERLRSRGFVLLDTQFTTAHLRTLGAIDVPKVRYQAMLADAISRKAEFWP